MSKIAPYVSLDSDADSFYCAVVKNASRSADVVEKLISGFQDEKLVIRTETNAELDFVYLLIAAEDTVLEEFAEAQAIHVKLDSKYVSNAKTPAYAIFKKKLRLQYQKQSGNSLFSSLDKQKLVQRKIDDVVRFVSKTHKHATLDVFPLHVQSERDKLRRLWVNSWFSFQPLDLVRDYLGESIAMYFAFLGFYTLCLIPLSIVGLVAQVFQLMSHDLDHVTVPIYCVFLAFWSTVWIEYWKQVQSSWAFRWDTLHFEEEEHIRPEFVGVTKKGYWSQSGFIEMNSVYDRLKNQYPKLAHRVPENMFESQTKKIFRYLVSIPIISTFIIATAIGTSAILFFKNIASVPIEQGGYGAYGSVLAGIINAMFIMFMNVVYGRVAVVLNSFENHPTETVYQDNLIAKTFAFQFVNSYISLFFIAFVKGRDIRVLGFEPGNCRVSCFQELATQLLTLVLYGQIVGQIKELFIPWLTKKVNRMFVWCRVKSNTQEHSKPFYEKQRALPPNPGPFDDFNEMAIQFGFVVMFAAAFPIASVAALVNNWTEIRVDAAKVINFTRRPAYRGCEDIGTWQTVFQALSVLCVLTNACLLGFTSSYMSGKCQLLENIPQGCSGKSCEMFKGDQFRAVSANSFFNLHGLVPEFRVNCTSFKHPLFREAPACCPTHETYLPESSVFPVTHNGALFLSNAEVLWCVLLVENFLLLVKFVLAVVIPDQTIHVTREIARQKFEKELLLEHFQGDDEPV
eukprot:c11743_g1_i5.p1 GENE.c11743_g1_i5~~c11743_g1_i5.p1  ORF type:complete len:739 (+),score=209.09 c11743_g1_i5:120-2336(+)